MIIITMFDNTAQNGHMCMPKNKYKAIIKNAILLE